MKNHLSKLLVAIMATFLFGAGSVFAQAPGAKKTATSFKSILAKVPGNVRTEFLESMFFLNGQLASARIDGLKSSLSKPDFEALKQIVGWGTLGIDNEGYRCTGPGECKRAQDYICNTKACVGSTEGVALDNLLRSIPPAARRQYLDSLDFKAGRFTGGDVKIIERHVNKADLDRLNSAARAGNR